VVSMLITQSAHFSSGAQRWLGTMVDWVHTERDMQGRGLAAALLEAVAQRYAEEGHDFLLLWARQHGYYRSQGFHVSDSTLLAESATTALEPFLPQKGFVSTEVPLPSLREDELASLDKLAASDDQGGIPFMARKLNRIPLPFDRISLVRAGKPESPDAYALLGHEQGWLTVLEGAGEPNALASLIVSGHCEYSYQCKAGQRASSLHGKHIEI
jgi:Acetyltransferase (GNAT) domain